MTSIKGHNSVINLRKIMSNNPNQDLVNINAYIRLSSVYLFSRYGAEILTLVKVKTLLQMLEK